MRLPEWSRSEWTVSPSQGVGMAGFWVFLRAVNVDAGVAATPALLFVDGAFVTAACCFFAGLAAYWVDLPVDRGVLGLAGSVLAFVGGTALGIRAALGLAGDEGWGAVALIAGIVVLVLVVVPTTVAAVASHVRSA